MGIVWNLSGKTKVSNWEAENAPSLNFITVSGISKTERKTKALKALEVVGLSDQVKKRPNQLSGGQMQRVAIARAIVNNPDIILADEPTGALDSVTSVQVMDILKDLAKERLVVMVTHNKELADKYSTRIIEFLDGEMTNDTMSFTPSKENYIENNEIKEKVDLIEKAVEEDAITDYELNGKETVSVERKLDIDNFNKENDKKYTKSKEKSKKSAMSFFTAFNLSLRNLFTKRTRTILTSFAGSIGIIGVALVLAVSNGFTKYINKMQSDTLSGYPIVVGTITADMESIASGMMGSIVKKQEYPSTDKLYVEDTTASLATLGKYSFISPEFIDYIKDYQEQDLSKLKEQRKLNDVVYSFASPMTVIGKQGNRYGKIDTSISSSVIGASSSGIFYEGLPSEEFVSSQYDVIYGSYPKQANELALVVSSTNTVSKQLLDRLMIEYVQNANGTINSINFEDLVSTNEKEGKTFKLVYNNQCWNNVYDVDGETIIGFTENTNYKEMYDSADGLTLKITGVFRVKKSSPLSIYSSGIVYTPKLTEHFRENAKESTIVKTQIANPETFYNPYVFNVDGMGPMGSFTTAQDLIDFAKHTYKVDMTKEQALQYNLQQYGASSIPNSINLYPANFDAKDDIVNYIKAWNKQHPSNEIHYSDATSILSSTLGELVDIISYVLVAFASISLVVSSIMIGIITYVSVVERTKEIGVLRALGARKKDIARVFNAETLIIGFSAGLIGVVVSFVLTFPINAIIGALASNIGNIAVLSIFHAIALILVSMGLTLISGLIPSSIASKKDPVVALRTE